MKIYLREITDHETELEFTQDEPWVAEAVKRLDEQLENDPARGRALAEAISKRTIRTDMSIRKVDDVVVVNGGVQSEVQLVCSRCANYFAYPIDSHYSALFCKDPVMAGVAHLQKGETRDAPPTPMGRKKGHARHAHDPGDGHDLDITYISEDFIDLAAVLVEQMTLQLPFQPLCSEDCKGICSNCGADLNTGRCPCSKLGKNNPFSVLKDLKV